MKLRHLIVGVCLGAAAVVSAQQLPELGDTAAAQLSPQLEQRIADEIVREIRRSPALVDDAELSDYLNALGHRLVANSPGARQNFRFFLIKDPSINAAAFVGGVIIVHTGLLLAAQSESEVAGVLAHEIAHVTQHHIARMIAKQEQATLPTLAALALAILAARSNPQVAEAAIVTSQAAAIQAQLNFSRDAEREADRVGLQILERAGFDPRAMPAFFEKLQRAGRFQESAAPAYLRTHPLTYERIADIQNRVQSLPYRQVPDSADFFLIRAKLQAMQGPALDAVRDFEAWIREKKYAHEMATRYGLARALVRAQQLSRAEAELKALRGHFPAHPMVETLAGELLLAQGKRSEALEHYRKALATFPQHRALVYDYARALLADGQAEAAVRFVSSQLEYFPDDPRLYRLQAEAHGARGEPLAAHRAQAEAYVREGDLSGAVQQLELAARSGGDFYQLSIVEARLRELRRELAALQREAVR
ncbi:M48 family metalloprotease [Pelomicrobium sp.]|jgi:predicted Zn-dependent protease|uniref:M48 family metalloprotease n=1 Tax=Pelomicrobium sp. TaxID=2815319 RepID=UPI002FDE028E